ncbi:MAG: alkaline shock response membrane anchor protein AmaP [Saccharospirillum sp.]|nr:alkaline shock response membrane anchor protein AmaP [Saccharospirillum sp.]
MERRQGPDFWLKLFYIILSLGWLGLIAFQVLWWLAKPEMDTGLVRFHNIEMREDWVSEIAVWIPVVLTLCVLSSLWALHLQRIRGRRHLDGTGWSIWLLLALVLVSGTLFGLSYTR